VTVNELVRAVNRALDNAPASECPAADANGDGAVVITEVIAGVTNALTGCPLATAEPGSVESAPMSWSLAVRPGVSRGGPLCWAVPTVGEQQAARSGGRGRGVVAAGDRRRSQTTRL
jgi:hypothetical protein